MGTSTSSSGPASGIPMDPPWLDDIGKETSNPSPGDSEDNQTTSSVPVELSPRGRFKMARQNLGEFAQTGSRTSFKKSVGHYSKTGMGGASNVAQRMRASTKAASGLVSFLRDIQNNVIPQIKEWVQTLLSKRPSANEVIDAIVERVSNEGGTLDEDSIKNSMASAMSELLEQNPDTNLFNLGDNETWDLIEYFLAHETANRLQLDIGQLLENADLTPQQRVERTEEMYEYLKSEITSQIQPYRSSNIHPEIEKLNSIMHQALENTFMVYEEAIE